MEKCPACNNEIKDDFNVCPYCLEPLNDMAKKLFLEKEKSAQLKLLSALIEKANDEKAVEEVKKEVEKTSKKKTSRKKTNKTKTVEEKKDDKVEDKQ